MTDKLNGIDLDAYSKETLLDYIRAQKNSYDDLNIKHESLKATKQGDPTASHIENDEGSTLAGGSDSFNLMMDNVRKSEKLEGLSYEETLKKMVTSTRLNHV